MGEQLQYGYFGHIAKWEKTDDGTLMVYGKAAGPDLDLDGQRCDPTWLKSAMPAWHEWGNVREQHANIAAGVGVELTQDGDDWFLKAEIVDPGTIRKVEKRVLKGFSVGIMNGRVIKSAKAPMGVIDDGTISEISLVDRPCNPTATLSIAKSAGGAILEPVEADMEDLPEAEPAEVVEADDLAALAAAGLLVNPEPLTSEKSAGWYREALRTVQDAHAGLYANVDGSTTINKAAEPDHADVSAAYAAIDQILDLIVAEAQQAKGGRVKELRDIEVLLSAARALCCFVDIERDEDDERYDSDTISAYGDKVYMKAYGASSWTTDGEIARQGLDKIEKRDFSQGERDEAAESGNAMPNGTYPIETQKDLENAVHLAGHSKAYSRTQVMAHIRRMARKHGLTMPSSTSEKSATVDDATAEIITKAVSAAQAESTKAHEAELAALRAELEKALAVPTPGGPVTFKHANSTSSVASRQSFSPADPQYWTELAASPGIGVDVARAYLAKAASLNRGAST